MEKNPQQILLHVGTNDLRDQNPNVVVDNVVELAKKIIIESETNARIILSELVARSGNVSSDSVKTVNRKLKKFSNQNNWKLIQHQNITTNDLNQSGLHLRATLPKILIFNFHPEIDFAHNPSIKFTWQVGNKYEVISELNFSDRNFWHPGMCSKFSGELKNFQLSVLKNTDHSKALISLVINNDPLS